MNREIKWLGESPGTIGQTRYQEYNPRTGAAIGTPLTEAEYRSRSNLRPFTRVRAVSVQGPLWAWSPSQIQEAKQILFKWIMMPPVKSGFGVAPTYDWTLTDGLTLEAFVHWWNTNGYTFAAQPTQLPLQVVTPTSVSGYALSPVYFNALKFWLKAITPVAL